MGLKLLFFSVIISLLSVSCSFKPQHVLFEQKGNSDTLTQQNTPFVYRIKPDDELQIRNVQDPKAFANDGTAISQGAAGQIFKVEEDGMVGLPIIGHIKVAGLTGYEAEKKIELLYRDSSLKSPIFDLKILNLKVTVLGEIRAQGNYALTKERTTLIDIIGQAGGLTNNADEKNVKIIRGREKRILMVDLSDIKTIYDPRIILQDGDIITIPQNKRAVRDDKIQNLSTIVQPVLLIINSALIIYSLFRLK
jgi:polysaccharide export outer membrane protein